MKRVVIYTALTLAWLSSLNATSCPSALLSTYLSGGTPCTENGGSLTITFNHDPLPSYVGLNLLSSSGNSAADPAHINVIPGTLGLTFESADFSESSLLVSSQAELVHFLVDSTTPILSTNFFLENAQVSDGALNLGTGLAIGQELVCVGGTFTSLPVGLITSVTNGVLGSGQFGCNGTALVGTAAVSAGPLNALTGLLGLPNLAGLTDHALIQLIPTNQFEIDVIKIQGLVSILNGSASTTGFGNNFTVLATPEPESAGLFLAGAIMFGISVLLKRRRNAAVQTQAVS